MTQAVRVRGREDCSERSTPSGKGLAFTLEPPDVHLQLLDPDPGLDAAYLHQRLQLPQSFFQCVEVVGVDSVEEVPFEYEVQPLNDFGTVQDVNVPVVESANRLRLLLHVHSRLARHGHGSVVRNVVRSAHAESEDHVILDLIG